MRGWGFFTLIAVAFAFGGRAEPFGLEAGMGRGEVEGVTGPLREVSPGVFLASEVPGGYPELETYSLFLTPEHGLCRIQATSEVIPAGGAGAELRERFNLLMERLWEAHGFPEVVDRLSADSSWSGADEWMVALYERERILMTLWAREGGSELPKGVEKVVLSARALKADEGFLTLDYTLSNWQDCRSLFREPAHAPTKRP